MMKTLLGACIAAGALLAVPPSMAQCSPADVKVIKASAPSYPARAKRRWREKEVTTWHSYGVKSGQYLNHLY